MNKKWFILVVFCISSFCLATEQIEVVVMYRLQQLWHTTYKVTPDKIEKALWPDLTTNFTLRSEHYDMYPREFHESAFVKNKENPFLYRMKILRYEEDTTNYTVIASSRISDRSNTNFVSQLKTGDIIFFHGHVD